MKTIKKVPIGPVYVDSIPEYSEMEYGKLYISKKYGCAQHLCLCGCKEPVITPLNEWGWNLTDTNGKVTLSPSIGMYQFPCNSHYIITNNIANFV